MILVIDTSAGQCAAALVSPEGVESGDMPGFDESNPFCALRAERMSRGHAEKLMPMIEAVTGGAYAFISRIAVCTGPGSFTGLRVGVAAARGLALGLSVPCIGVGRLEALGAGWTGHVALKGRGEMVFLQEFAEGRAVGTPRSVCGLPEEIIRGGAIRGDAAPGATEEDGLPDLLVIAGIANARDPGVPPAPLYLRAPNAAPLADDAPKILDP